MRKKHVSRRNFIKLAALGVAGAAVACKTSSGTPPLSETLPNPSPTNTPEPSKTLQPTDTLAPSPTSTPKPTPTQVSELSVKTYWQMRIEILAGEMDKYLSTTLTTSADYKRYYQGGNAETIRSKREQEVIKTLGVLDNNLAFHFKLKGVIVDEAFSGAVKNISLIQTEIIIKNRDEQGNFIYLDKGNKRISDLKGYAQIDVKGFAGGDGGIFVWGQDGLLRAILPKGTTDLHLWKFMPKDNSDVLVLSGQTYYGRLVIVGANGNVWGVAETDQNGRVMACGGKEGAVDRPESTWWVLPRALTPEAMPTPDKSIIGRVLGEAEKREKGLNGYAIEADGQVQGLETKFIFVTVPGLMDVIKKFGGKPPIHLNKNIDHPSPADRLAEAVRLSDYLGYLEDAGVSEDKYPFSDYIQDLINGQDRKYKIRCWNTGLFGECTVDPMKVHQHVWILEMPDPYGNGDAKISLGSDQHFGIVPLPDGGIRTIGVLPRDFFYLHSDTFQEHIWYLGAYSSGLLGVPRYVLSMAEEDQLSFTLSTSEEMINGLKSKAEKRVEDLLYSQLPGDDYLIKGTLFSIKP